VNVVSDSLFRKSRQADLELSSELHPERQLALLQAQTRRHFLRSLSGGLGTMFLCTMASPYLVKAAESATDGAPRLDFRRDPRNPLAALPPLATDEYPYTVDLRRAPGTASTGWVG